MASGIFEAIAFSCDLDDMSSAQKAVEDGGGGWDVANKFAPFFERAVAGHDSRAPLITAHDDFEEILSGLCREDLEPHVINDEEIRFEVALQSFLGFLEGLGFAEFYAGVENGAVKDNKADLCGLDAYSLCQVGFSNSWRA